MSGCRQTPCTSRTVTRLLSQVSLSLERLLRETDIALRDRPPPFPSTRSPAPPHPPPPTPPFPIPPSIRHGRKVYGEPRVTCLWTMCQRCWLIEQHSRLHDARANRSSVLATSCFLSLSLFFFFFSLSLLPPCTACLQTCAPSSLLMGWYRCVFTDPCSALIVDGSTGAWCLLTRSPRGQRLVAWRDLNRP